MNRQAPPCDRVSDTRRGPRAPAATRRPCERGTILIVTLGILIVLAALVLVLGRAMRVEALCSANQLSAEEAAAVEQGAIQYVIAAVDGLEGQVPTESDILCSGVQIGGGAFWILRPGLDDDRSMAYGLVDEASRLNLNTATEPMLSKLPDMTVDVAPGIIDWRDPDSEVSTGGAESEYYLLLAPPYECKNAPFETVEELLLVRLFTPELLFGEDTNRNGVLDPNEDDADTSDPPDNRDGHLDRGIYPFITVYSAEPNTDADGQPRINVNQAQGRELTELLQEAVPRERLAQLLDLIRRARPFKNVLDFHARSGLTTDEFKTIADRITTSGDKVLRGLLNVNTASKEALACLPDLVESDVSALLAGRPTDSAEPGDSAWVADVLTPAKAVAVGSYITGRSFQFSADIVSTSADGRAFRRCRIVVDALESPPRLVYRQDMTHLGWPLAADIVGQLRAGVTLEDVLAATRQEAR